MLVNIVKSRVFLCSFFLSVVCFFVYHQASQFSLLQTWDDQYYLLLNETIKSFTVEHVKDAFTKYYVANYAPIHILSYMLDYSIWGFDARFYHIENVLIHISSGVIFFFVLRKLGLPDVAAFIAAFIFLLHPVQVESVAWVSQRKNLLAMVFFLCALYGYITFRSSSDPKIIVYLSSLMFLILSLLSKSVGVIFPVVAILYDFSFQKQCRRMTFLDKIPFFLATAGFAVVTIISQSSVGAVRLYPGGTITSAAITMLPVLFSYIKDCFWPFTLSPYSIIEPRTSVDTMLVIYSIGTILLLATALLLLLKQRKIFFFYSLFFLALVPVMQFVPIVTLKNDRYLYFPMLGFSGFVAVILWTIWRNHLRYRILVVMLATAIGLALPIITYNLAGNWKNDLTLWSYAIKKDPENRMAWIMLSRAYTQNGNADGAIIASRVYYKLRDKYGPVRGFESN